MKIGVVIVTFNRINCLKKALSKYEEQKKEPQYIIVVNNCSSDGTNEFLIEWQNIKSNIKRYVINLNMNIGGSGGFYTGLEMAMKLDSDWIWLADDDAYPEYDALSNIENFYENNKKIDKKNICGLCSSVINNGNIDVNHRRNMRKDLFTITQVPINIKEYNNEYFELDLCSYVGCIFSKRYLVEAGLTEKDYFIYYDDTEHSYRMKKFGKIYCVPSSKVIHNVKMNSENVDWKAYYGLRNRILFYKKHFNYRYSFIICVRELTKCVLRTFLRKNKEYNQLIKSAIKDAENNVKGMHEIYKPGWKINR
jgi:GT2 family glycosyltransferase